MKIRVGVSTRTRSVGADAGEAPPARGLVGTTPEIDPPEATDTPPPTTRKVEGAEVALVGDGAGAVVVSVADVLTDGEVVGVGVGSGVEVPPPPGLGLGLGASPYGT